LRSGESIPHPAWAEERRVGSSPHHRLLAYLAVLFLVGAPAAPARAATDEGALWVTLHLALPVADRLWAHLVAQPRFDDDVSRLQRVVLRPWLEAALPHGFSGALGYDAHVIENPQQSLEQRIWQQVGYQRAWRPLRAFGGVRLEERFFEGDAGAALRARLRVGLGLPLPRSFELVAQNEGFWNLNRTGSITRVGYRENRLSAGIGRPVGERARADLGYQMQWQQRPASDRIFHTLMLGLRVELPPLPFP